MPPRVTLPAEQVRKLAYGASCSEQAVTACYASDPVQPTVIRRIAKAARELGIAEPGAAEVLSRRSRRGRSIETQGFAARGARRGV